MTKLNIQSVPVKAYPETFTAYPARLSIDEQNRQSHAPLVAVPVHQGRVGNLQPIIAVRDLTKICQDVSVLSDISFKVQPGEFVSILGLEASGKTSLLHVLGCLQPLSSGDYYLRGKMVTRMSADEQAVTRNLHIGFVFQDPTLLENASALQNVALPLAYAGFAHKEQRQRARRALQTVGLDARWQQKPMQLSVSQQQRVAIARAIVHNPTVLLADEPTGNLDTRHSIEIMALLQALNSRGLTIVLCTQEQAIASYTKRQIVLQKGSIVSDTAVSVPQRALDHLPQIVKPDESTARVQVGVHSVQVREEEL